MAPTITVDGDEIIDASIDGDAVEEITIDGDLAWAAAVGLDGLTVTRQDGSYTASSGEHVVSNGGTITLPSPVQDGIVMITKVQTTLELIGSVDGITDPSILGDDSVVFVSDGSAWYSVDRNQIGAIPDSEVFYSFNDGTATNQSNPGQDDGNPQGSVSFLSSGGVNGSSGYAEFSGGYLLQNNGDDFVNTYSTNSGPFTYLFWVRTSDFSSGLYNARGNRIRIYFNSNNELGFQLFSSTSTAVSTNAVNFNSNEWQMVTARYDDSKNPDMRITINNDFNNQGTANLNASIEQDLREEYIMANIIGDGTVGDLDHFRFYSSFLSDAQISDIYNATKP